MGERPTVTRVTEGAELAPRLVLDAYAGEESFGHLFTVTIPTTAPAPDALLRGAYDLAYDEAEAWGSRAAAYRIQDVRRVPADPVGTAYVAEVRVLVVSGIG